MMSTSLLLSPWIPNWGERMYVRILLPGSPSRDLIATDVNDFVSSMVVFYLATAKSCDFFMDAVCMPKLCWSA